MQPTDKQERWRQDKLVTPEKIVLARKLLDEVRVGRTVLDALPAHPLSKGKVLSKAALVAAYNEMTAAGEFAADKDLLDRIRMKPVRTLSGVTTVTVLTKPYPCPGKCIFCPTDVRMPKSYLPDEPGAMRALEHDFDPYTQVRSRINALENLGHPTDKIELLILGGTWSAYRRDYQEWFVKRCFDAMNETNPTPLASPHGAMRHEGNEGSEACLPGELALAQEINEKTPHRNVGLVIETRPDEITPDELRWLRTLGVTKVQMGAQSLDDRILEMNKRGHTVERTRQAVSLLRAAGFKIVLHWMPNLHGATPESDRVDFAACGMASAPMKSKFTPTNYLPTRNRMKSCSHANFISFITPPNEPSPGDRLAGFIRLSLPSANSPATRLADLDGAALIREVHVYGQSLPVGAELSGATQHSGLGTKLLQEAEEIARAHGFHRMAVISAVGARKYYLGPGFWRGELYLVKNIPQGWMV